ncbi:MAG: shikimate dehydrogenase [bacterium]|nr:shikimate dehydrogenase [bacterium]
MKIEGTTRITGLFGYPVRHTFSPAMHNAAFAERAMDYAYVPFEVHPRDLKAAVAALIPLGIVGVNITIPHKETVIPLLDEISEEAALMGSVNTIQVTEGRLKGHNTDAYGYETSLRLEGDFELKDKRIFVLGAGGAARAVCFQSALAGVAELVIADVVGARAEALGEAVLQAFPDCGVEICSADAGVLRKALAGKDLFVNATPIGMKVNDPQLIDAAWLDPSALVFDVIYNPEETRLLREAKAQGFKTLNGIGMLVHQGARAFEIFTGVAAPVTVMAEVLREKFQEHP